MSTQPTPTKKRRGYCLPLGVGCLGVIGLACIGILLVLVFGGSDSEVRYSGAEDLSASQDFEEIFLDLGIQGVEVIVIPARGEGGAVLIIKMDESKGFSNIAGAGFDGVLNALTDKIQQGNYDIDYMSLGYIGPEGELLFTMTTDEETVAAYTSGEITRREFMGNVSVDAEGILEMLDAFNEVAP